MAKPFLCLILLCGFATVVASEVHYIIRPSQSQSCDDSAECGIDSDLTFYQFIDSSSDYLTNNTRLIFSSGNYSLESELVVENIHSFSMFVWPGSSSKAVITCGHNARFEFRNVSTVTVSGLEFVGCFENHVISVGHFQLENSGFFGNDQAIVNGTVTVLIIDESAANLEKVVFISVVDKALTTPQELYSNSTELVDRAIGISLRESSISISQSWFEGNSVGAIGAVIYDEFGSDITIINTTFFNNSASLSDMYTCYYCNYASIVYAKSHGSTVRVHNCKFVQNVGRMIFADSCNMFITHIKFINNEFDCSDSESDIDFAAINITHTNLTVSHSTFINNRGTTLLRILHGMNTTIEHSKFVDNNGKILLALTTDMVSVTHCEFINNIKSSCLVYLEGIMISLHLSKFVNNRVDEALVYMPYYNEPELANNLFTENSATYEVFVSPFCRPGLSHSLGSSRCIQCSENWHRDLIGIVVAAFIAGIALVILMLALNTTVAVGTLNGILFYANIVAANADTYFLPFKTPGFVTVFISWLNLDIGFDVCFYGDDNIINESGLTVYKPLLQLVFPAYIIFLVITVIVASRYSSKFAKIIGKGNPVAVLATMILLSYTKFSSTFFLTLSSLYVQPAHGSRNFDVSRSDVFQFSDTEVTLKSIVYSLVAVLLAIALLCVIFSVLVFSWQWLLRFQNKTIFKWVRYQKLRLFIEPYHAPYTAKYRYWTGLLLLVRVLLYLISVLNFSLDPRVDLMAAIFIVGGLTLLKGVTAKRVYKNWPLDVMETAIYFNLVAFSTLTWYNLDFGGNQLQVAVVYMSVMMIFILLLGVIVFHVLRYTRLYECWSFVEKAFKRTFSKLLRKEQSPNDELDGYQLIRSATGDQTQPTITFSVIELSQPAQNYTE